MKVALVMARRTEKGAAWCYAEVDERNLVQAIERLTDGVTFDPGRLWFCVSLARGWDDLRRQVRERMAP